MKKSLLALAVLSAVATMSRVRAHTQDISYGYRMPTGFPGDPNRTHPFNIVPGLNQAANPCRLYGDPVIIDTATNSYRAFLASDQNASALNIDGVAVRPYPTQQTTGGLTATIGTGTPAVNQPLDVLSEGYIMVKVNGAGSPTKKGGVWIWCAASTGNHVLGGFESAATAGSTTPVANAFFNGPPGTDGVTELVVFRPSV